MHKSKNQNNSSKDEFTKAKQLIEILEKDPSSYEFIDPVDFKSNSYL